MAPITSMIYHPTKDRESVIQYTKYRPNENVIPQAQPFQNINNGTHEGKEDVTPQTQPFQTINNGTQEEEKEFHTGDKVVIKQMDIKRMKQLQKNHGEWHPKIEQAIGQHGIVTHVHPDGDLQVVTRNLIQWTFNPKCITPTYTIKEGEKARFKNLPTDDMKRKQELNGVWLPIMEDMKGRLCTVQGVHHPHMWTVQMLNGYMFEVNPNLLEEVDQNEQEKMHERFFKKGDVVRIKDMGNKGMKDEFKRYGIDFNPDVSKTKGKTGKVRCVNQGFEILIEIQNAPHRPFWYPPGVLVLEKETTNIAVEPGKEILLTIWEQHLTQLGIKTAVRRLAMELTESTEQGVTHVLQQIQKLSGKKTHFAEHLKKTGKDQQHHFQQGDIVCVKILNPEEMMKKQEDHGGWNPQMIYAMGKNGVVEQMSPSGDLQITFDNPPALWCFNPECVTLLEKCEPHGFKAGQIVRFKNLPTAEMIRLQNHHGGWVPLMADMKNKLCIIQACHAKQLTVEMKDGYIWAVNPKLLEAVEDDPQEMKFDRGFTKRDTVEIMDMSKDEMKKLCKHHGIGWNNDIFNAKQHKGMVLQVEQGRVVHVYVNMKGGTMIKCCRPILNLAPVGDGVDFDDLAIQQNVSMSLRSDGQVQATYSESLVRSTPKTLLDSIALESIPLTKRILKKHPHWVDTISDDGQNTALMNACSVGNLDFVKLLVDAGAHLDMDNIDGNTAVIVSALRNETEILKYLLDKGAKLDVTNIGGCNALHAALEHNSTNCLRVLLERCSANDFNKENHQGMMPINIAIMEQDETIWTMMIESKHFDVAAKSDSGFTALHAAALTGNERASQIILSAHPELINCQMTDNNWTPLHLAAFNKHCSLVKLLVDQKNCDKNPRTEDGETPLLLAECHKEIIDLLLESGADANIANEDGETCLHQVFKLREKSIQLQSFLKHKMPRGFPSVEVPETPSSKDCIGVAKMLIHKEADVDTVDKFGKTPLDYIKDETIKADIIAEMEADNCLKTYLEDFEKRMEKLSEDDRLKQVYQTTTFAARYFDIRGGYLEIPEADVRMYIPPGAVKQARQLIYINLDQVNHDIAGSISPVVQAGPPGTRFRKQITLSYPHCAANESEWEFRTLISEDSDVKWMDVDSEDGVESRIKNGRVIVKTVHFTRLTTAAEPKTQDNQKCMRVGAFGREYTKGDSTYQFRVRTWEDTKATRQVVLKKETQYLQTKPIDDDRPLRICNTDKDVSVEVNKVRQGWKLREEESQQLNFSDVWNNTHPSCTFDLDTMDESKYAKERVHCAVKANQLESPEEDVKMSISPATINPEEGKSTSGTTSSHAKYPSPKDVLYGKMPEGIPNMPSDLYTDLCAVLTLQDDVHGDWRKIMSEMGLGDVTTVEGIRELKDCPANFALGSYLLLRKSEGSDYPVGDLTELFEKLDLKTALQCIQTWKSSGNHDTSENRSYAAGELQQPSDPQPPGRSDIVIELKVDYSQCTTRKSIAYKETVKSVLAILNEKRGGTVRLWDHTGEGKKMYEKFDINLDSELENYKLATKSEYDIIGVLAKHRYRDLQVFEYTGMKIHTRTHAYRKTQKSSLKVTTTTELCNIARSGLQPVDPNKYIPLRECLFYQGAHIGDETVYLEFKKYKDGENLIDNIFDDMKEYMSAFGNTYGGVLYFGVDDDGLVQGHDQEWIGDETEFRNRFIKGKLQEMMWLQNDKQLRPEETLKYWDVKFISVTKDAEPKHKGYAQHPCHGSTSNGLKHKVCTDADKLENRSTTVPGSSTTISQGKQTSAPIQDIDHTLVGSEGDTPEQEKQASITTQDSDSQTPSDSPTCSEIPRANPSRKKAGKSQKLSSKVVIEVEVKRLTNGIIFTSLPECPKYDKFVRMMTDKEWLYDVMPTLFNCQHL